MPRVNGNSPHIAVLGSINMDLVVECERLVRPGETILATSAKELPGGKGANQAVAAARLGANVQMFGRVGDDAFASRLIEGLQKERIDVSGVKRSSETASGLAIVSVEASGENAIVVVPGANALVSATDVDEYAERIRGCDVLLLQLEIPIEAATAGIEAARRAGTWVILDPAPAISTLPESLFDVDLVVPNRSEAATILDRRVETIDDAVAAARAFVSRGVKNAIITLGKQGAVVCDGERAERIEPFAVKTSDTTAAGDAFAAAIAVRWSSGSSLFDAARYACAAGAVAASRPGAQTAMPSDRDVQELLAPLRG